MSSNKTSQAFLSIIFLIKGRDLAYQIFEIHNLSLDIAFKFSKA